MAGFSYVQGDDHVLELGAPTVEANMGDASWLRLPTRSAFLRSETMDRRPFFRASAPDPAGFFMRGLLRLPYFSHDVFLSQHDGMNLTLPHFYCLAAPMKPQILKQEHFEGVRHASQSLTFHGRRRCAFDRRFRG
jgi:hypothetical protein